ncbi:TolC family protein [Gemmatimonadales bacterium]|nr:TolC family protein [Gemmatimonadales bacterium]
MNTKSSCLRWSTLLGLMMLFALWASGSTRVSAQETERSGLTVLVRTALDSNDQLVAAREAYNLASEQVSEAWGSVMPTVDLNASYQRNLSVPVNFLPAAIFDPTAGPDDYLPVQFGADNQWNSTISVEQPLFKPSVIVALGAAQRFENLQVEAVRGREQSVVTQVRNSYYQLLLAQEQARLTEKSVNRVRESLEETKALNRGGLAADYAVLRLEVELANLEPNLRRAKNAVLQARRSLAVLANYPDHEALEVQGSLAEMDLDDLAENSPENRAILEFNGAILSYAEIPESELETGLARAAEFRSDLRQFALTEELRRTEMRLEQASYLPEISVFGNYIVSAQDNGSPSFFGRGDGQSATSRALGLRVSVPIFQGLRRDARIDQKRASLREAQASSRQAFRTARSQIRTISEDIEEADLRASGQALAVRQAERGFEIASAQYAEGLSSQLELTDAEVALRQSEFNYAQAVFDYLVARAQFDEATGQVPLVDVLLEQREEDR